MEATAPVTIAAESDVPPAWMEFPLTTQVGHSDVNALSGDVHNASTRQTPRARASTTRRVARVG
jgi:hypothetical protein